MVKMALYDIFNYYFSENTYNEFKRRREINDDRLLMTYLIMSIQKMGFITFQEFFNDNIINYLLTSNTENYLIEQVKKIKI